ncbi:MAG: hypothetical protein EOP87_12565 [Verrucomicrobiaceae bacterium]|nr:MAG: hypothetical protein EOP87_12565 [Verrucomicrobiaceae bacterium]
MPPAGTTSTSDLPPAKSRILRARSLPSSRPFTIAVVFSALHYLGVITLITAFALFFREQSQLAVKVIVGSLIFSVVTWLIAFFKRRSAHCPLCKGTPLINSGALAHSKASRIYPFNHGVSATVSIIATQTFRCMYCGSDFDLMKTPSHMRDRYRDTTE